MILGDENNNKQNKKNHGAIKPVELEAIELELDRTYEKNIRPKTFDDYIGQNSIKETLKITIEAAKKEMYSWIIFSCTDPRARQNNSCKHNRKRVQR